MREVILRKLRISRDVPVMRVKRTTNGPEVRGCKPVTVYFEKWQDKDEVLRKNNLLRGSNIYISEDFSKRVRDQVNTLNEFIRSFHQFVSLIFSTNISQFEQLKKKGNFILDKTVFFSQFASWKRNHSKYTLKKL